MVVRLAGLIFLALITAAHATPLLVDNAHIAALRADTKVATSLLKKCDAESTLPIHAVADFAPQPHYTDAGANPDDDEAKGLTGDIRRAYRAALCYRLIGYTAYAQQTQAIADAWATTMKSASNAQGRADINFNIAQLIVAASWVDGVAGWNAAPFKSWLKTAIAPLSLSAEPNNRGNWGNLQDVASAAFTDDKPKLQAAAQRWSDLLASEIAADGTLPLEVCRSNSANHCDGADKGVNGLAYTHFALLPATLAGFLLEQAGQESFKGTSGAAFAKAIAATANFVRNPQQFPFFASNHGVLNKVDYCAYFAPAAQRFPDKNARDVLAAGTCKSDYWLLMQLFGAD